MVFRGKRASFGSPFGLDRRRIQRKREIGYKLLLAKRVCDAKCRVFAFCLLFWGDPEDNAGMYFYSAMGGDMS